MTTLFATIVIVATLVVLFIVAIIGNCGDTERAVERLNNRLDIRA
jgi:hypothetical protein